MDASITQELGVEREVARPVQKLELQCGSCGYGVVVKKAPASCPMCREEAWEAVPWRPFSRG
jgi:rubrerythrin